MKWLYKKEIIPAVFFTIVLVLIALFNIESETYRYKEKGQFTSAQVIGFEYDYKGRLQITYEYIVGETKRVSKEAFPELKRGAERYLMKKNFPAIYIPGTNESRLLASPTQFKNLSLALPDSLLWLKKIELSW